MPWIFTSPLPKLHDCKKVHYCKQLYYCPFIIEQIKENLEWSPQPNSSNTYRSLQHNKPTPVPQEQKRNEYYPQCTMVIGIPHGHWLLEKPCVCVCVWLVSFELHIWTVLGSIAFICQIGCSTVKLLKTPAFFFLRSEALQ